MAKVGSRQIEEEYKILSLKEDLRRKKTDRLIRMTVYTTALYSVLIMFFLVLRNSEFLTSFLLRGEFSNKTNSEIKELQTEIRRLRDDFNSLNENISSIPSDVKLDKRINELESRQRALGETILYDPDKALTSRLLREKQIVLEESVRGINASNERLTSKVDDFISKIITIPIIGFVLAVLTALLAPLFNRITDKIKGSGKSKSESSRVF